MKMDNIQLIILCGGLGTRIKSISKEKPKILCEFEGKSYLEYLLEKVIAYNFTDIILSAGFKGELLSEWLEKSRFSNQVRIVIEEIPLGTGGAIKFASTDRNKDKIIINGDTVFELDMVKFYHSCETSDIKVVMKKVKRANYPDSGFFTIDINNKVLSFNEKSKKNPAKIDYGLINTGIYFIRREIIDVFPNITPYSLEYDFFPSVIRDKAQINFDAYIYGGLLIDFGTSKGHQKAKSYFQSKSFD